jgi:hypothetical protein
MTGVMLGQGVVLVFLLTVRGHVHPIGRSGCRGEGPMAPCLARRLHMSLGRGRSVLRGSGAPVPMLQGSGAFDDVMRLGRG